MNIETRKINLAQLLFTVQQEAILDKIEALLKKETSSVLSDEQKRAIDEGLVAPVIPHEQVMSETKNRFPNLFK